MSVPGDKNAASCCLCTHFGNFWTHIQGSTGSHVAELVDHMDSCRHWIRAAVDATGVDTRWAIHLSENCPAQQNSGLVRQRLVDGDRWAAVLDLCPPCPVRDNLTALLLLASVRYGRGDLASRFMLREWVSDSLLMKAILFAAHLRDRSPFLLLIRACPRSHRVFKEKFVHQFHRESPQSVSAAGEGVRWAYKALYEGGEKDLALFVAASHPHQKALIAEFCQDELEINNFDLKQDKNKVALRKLCECSVDNYRKFLERLYKSPDRSESDRTFLIRQALQQKEYDLFITLCNSGVLQKDLKFCASFLLSGEAADCEEFSQICAQLGREERKRLRLCAARFTMKRYFRLKSDANLEAFIEQFPHHDSVDASPVMSCLFRKAIKKCVDLDYVDCFVRLCMKYCVCGSIRNLSKGKIYLGKDYVFACQYAKPHFIAKMFEFRAQEKIELVSFNTFDASKLLFLIDAAVAERAWMILPVVLSENKFCTKGFMLVEKCLHKMLADHSTRLSIAPVVDQCLKEGFVSLTTGAVCDMQKSLAKEEWASSMPDLKQWSVDNGHPTLAFFLAVVSEDWEMVERVVISLTTLELHAKIFWIAVELAAKKHLFSLCVAMLKVSIMTAEVVHFFNKFKCHGCLAEICEDQGLFEWALVLESRNLTYLKEHRTLCPNHDVWGWIVKKAVTCRGADSLRWDIAKEFFSSCTDSEILKSALQAAVRYIAPVDAVKDLLHRVDPAACVEIDDEEDCELKGADLTLLFAAAENLFGEDRPTPSKEQCDRILKTIRLLLASGMSTFQRNEPRRGNICPLFSALDDAMDGLFKVPGINSLVKLLLNCGAVPYKTLSEMSNCTRFLAFSNTAAGEEWKEAYRSVQEAAATPCHLQHLARLAVSHSVGCQPGRADRIDSLPLPSVLKDRVHFKDVLKEESDVDERLKWMLRTIDGKMVLMRKIDVDDNGGEGDVDEKG